MKFKCLSGILFLILCSGCNQKEYVSEGHDLLNVREYKLDNGLTVYMTVNEDAPRVQTMIGVRAGSKNDPSNSTGLAHYFEHMMFKGTSKVGTKDWEKEKPLLDEIENLFEEYRNTTNQKERTKIYSAIDSISYEASKYAIANEYDKLMNLIGSQGSNAWTSTDETVYLEDIPSNQISNWAKIQGDRFGDPVLRIFHTELEAVYEEKNMYLNSDMARVTDSLLLALFPFHNYGLQPTIGTEEHLKSPSITDIKQFYSDYYVPNNMVIVMSGDFKPDSVINIIKENFGHLKPKEINKYVWEEPETESGIVTKEVVGKEGEFVSLAYRLPGTSSDVSRVSEILTEVIFNENVGLIDLNLKQQQLVNDAYAFNYTAPDYSILILEAKPKAGQTLEETKDLLLAQIDSVKQGMFGDWLVPALLKNKKLENQEAMLQNYNRANTIFEVFISDVSWSDYVKAMNDRDELTKDDIVKYANMYLNDNYAIVYKRQDPNFSFSTFPKPQITSVDIDRDSKSDFYVSIEESKVDMIEPEFVDLNKEVKITEASNGLTVWYKNNKSDDLFELTYHFDFGSYSSKTVQLALSYMKQLGTTTLSSEELKTELFKLACSFDFIVMDDFIEISLLGLEENRVQAMKLMEESFNNIVGDEEIFNEKISQILTQREDDIHNFGNVSKSFRKYLLYGPQSISGLTNKELQQLTSKELINEIKSLNKYKHIVMYFGPANEDELLNDVNEIHAASEVLNDIPEVKSLSKMNADKNSVYFIDFTGKQSDMIMTSPICEYSKEINPIIDIYNSYIGNIVYQDLREAKGLAYSVSSRVGFIDNNKQKYSNLCFIGTQPDKLKTAVDAFDKLLINMPESEEQFEVAKKSIVSSLRTKRLKRTNVFSMLLNMRRFNLTTNPDLEKYEMIQSMTFETLKEFQKDYIKPLKYNYGVVGNSKDIDMNYIKTLGNVKFLNAVDVLGY